MPHRRQGFSLHAWLRAFRPAPIAADAWERVRVVIGATLGLLATALLSRAIGGPYPGNWPWLVAPMGASAVLVFATPASPLAQPWAVVGGNTLSALVGLACVRWLGPTQLAGALAVGAALGLMFSLRCLHPPGGASALLVVLNGVHDPRFALHPVLLNSLLLVTAGMAYNQFTRRPYPHMQLPEPVPVGGAGSDASADAVDADLDAVLARYNQVLDVSRDDLKALLADTQMRAFQRRLAELCCGDIMSPNPIAVHHHTPLREAWDLFRAHRVKALPVVDAASGLVGIVTPADFLRAAESAGGDSFEQRLRTLQGWSEGEGPAGPKRVGEIMTRQVRVASVDRRLADLIPLFGSSGHHHIPVVDGADRLVGIITQSDVVAALSRPDNPHG